ncbi:MAG: TonB-dependent receptor [Candidatus Acidiferrales bacterium]
MNKSCDRLWSALVVALCICFAATLLATPVSAQSTFGSITGTVKDASGAAVPGAEVTLTSSTGAKATFTSGADGEYTFVNLNPGPYTIDVDKAGFKHVKRQDVTVQVQIGTRIDITLEVGAQTQTVEVTAETPLLQPTSSSLGQVVDERKTNEIPLNGRNVFNLILLSPAAVAQGGSGGTPVGQNPFSWGNYQVGGSFANQSAEYLDGQPLNIGYINLPIIIPTQDSISEFKVEYNNVGAEWGKFSGGVVNFSTKGGTTSYHGEAYEYLRNKVLNATPYFSSTNPPYVQNQYGFALGGPIPHFTDKLFFFTSWEQFRLRQGASPEIYTVPLPQMFTPNAAGFYDFSSLCPGISATGTCPTGGTNPGIQLYNPYTANTTTGLRQPYLGNLIPEAQGNPAAIALYQKLYPVIPSTSPATANYTAGGSIGGNTNQFVTRIDYNINSTTRVFGRYSYYGLTDLPTDPFATGFCADRCAEKYHTKALALDLNHQFSATTIFDFNVSASRFVYARAPINSDYDLTQLGWGSVYNDLSASLRTPPTPAFTYPNDPGLSQGPGSAIGDHNSQYNFSPVLTLIRGKHTIAVGGQLEEGYDNYFQTNIAAGAFAFSNNWTDDNPLAPSANTGFGFADFLLGLADNSGHFVNQTEGVAQIPAQTAGKQTYRALYGQDTWRITQKLTINAGIRYELQGPWSERFNDLTYFNPLAVNGAVTGCNGLVGSPCTGDASYVNSGINGSRNNIPLDKRQWSPRLGLAYSFDQKTVIRAGYGIFYIPNYISFALNPDNDVIGLATTPYVATTDQYVTPYSTLNGTGGCGLVAGTPSCADNTGPFGAGGFVLPPGRNAQPNLSSFVAANGSPTLAPYSDPKPGYVQQYNLDVQREVGMGWFIDAAYAGSHGVHLQQYSTNIDQLPDSYVAQAAAQCPGFTGVTTTACTPSIAVPTANTLQGTTNGTLTAATLYQGQYDRPYPQYVNLNLGGYGCCESSYNSFQMTATKRFKNGGSFLAAYTNAKLMSNTDTLTSWLESSTGGVGAVQDYNNLKAERSLSSQDVSQRLVLSYVYDLPFGHGQRYMSDATGVADKIVSGWGVDGVTTFQKGFPLKVTWAGPSTPLESLNLGIANIRPDAVPDCNKGAGGSGGQAAKLAEWFNTSCFSAPPLYGYGTEARVDSSLRAAGINNWDIALFKTTSFGPDNKLGLQFRTEFFNTFNRVQFGFPGTGYNGTPGGNGFGTVTSQNNTPRLIQFALKFLF